MKSQRLGLFACAVLVSGCGTSGNAALNNSAATRITKAQSQSLKLTSDAFQAAQPIPTKFSCDGENHSPALHWSAPPAGTHSFALVIDDPDTSRGTFRHWGIYDIPASARGIPAGGRVGTEVNNDGGKPGYTGMCPPRGDKPHHYHFKLFAVSVDHLRLDPKASVADVEKAASAQALAQAELIGIYERPAP